MTDPGRHGVGVAGLLETAQRNADHLNSLLEVVGSRLGMDDLADTMELRLATRMVSGGIFCRLLPPGEHAEATANWVFEQLPAECRLAESPGAEREVLLQRWEQSVALIATQCAINDAATDPSGHAISALTNILGVVLATSEVVCSVLLGTGLTEPSRELERDVSDCLRARVPRVDGPARAGAT